MLIYHKIHAKKLEVMFLSMRVKIKVSRFDGVDGRNFHIRNDCLIKGIFRIYL